MDKQMETTIMGCRDCYKVWGSSQNGLGFGVWGFGIEVLGFRVNPTQ